MAFVVNPAEADADEGRDDALGSLVPGLLPGLAPGPLAGCPAFPGTAVPVGGVMVVGGLGAPFGAADGVVASEIMAVGWLAGVIAAGNGDANASALLAVFSGAPPENSGKSSMPAILSNRGIGCLLICPDHIWFESIKFGSVNWVGGSIAVSLSAGGDARCDATTTMSPTKLGSGSSSAILYARKLLLSTDIQLPISTPVFAAKSSEDGEAVGADGPAAADAFTVDANVEAAAAADGLSGVFIGDGVASGEVPGDGTDTDGDPVIFASGFTMVGDATELTCGVVTDGDSTVLAKSFNMDGGSTALAEEAGGGGAGVSTSGVIIGLISEVLAGDSPFETGFTVVVIGITADSVAADGATMDGVFGVGVASDGVTIDDLSAGGVDTDGVTGGILVFGCGIVDGDCGVVFVGATVAGALPELANGVTIAADSSVFDKSFSTAGGSAVVANGLAAVGSSVIVNEGRLNGGSAVLTDGIATGDGSSVFANKAANDSVSAVSSGPSSGTGGFSTGGLAGTCLIGSIIGGSASAGSIGTVSCSNRMFNTGE